MKPHKRAPAGYRIVKWADGFYHVYRGKWNCIEETTTKREAIEIAWADKAKQTPALPDEDDGEINEPYDPIEREPYDPIRYE